MENLEDLYQIKFDWIPESISRDIGHFNVFRLEPYEGERASPVTYIRPDYYRITLVVCNRNSPSANEVAAAQRKSLVFSNPQVPDLWEQINMIPGGYICLFDRHFFHLYENFSQYEVFQPNGTHIFDLSDEQASKLSGFYERMFEEINSGYLYKYDVLRSLVFEVLHFAMRMPQLMELDKL